MNKMDVVTPYRARPMIRRYGSKEIIWMIQMIQAPPMAIATGNGKTYAGIVRFGREICSLLLAALGSA